MGIRIIPWHKCRCGKLHLVYWITVCPNCKRTLTPWTGAQ